MKRYTDTLTGDELDLAVEMAEGCKFVLYGPDGVANKVSERFINLFKRSSPGKHTMEIIEREKISLVYVYGTGMWSAYTLPDTVAKHGPDPWTAALRYFVYRKLGNEIELPDITKEE